MGFALCRFGKDEGCYETGSREWHVYLTDQNKSINIPSMWKHYMTTHLVQPTKEEREVIMTADPEKTTGQIIQTRNMVEPERLHVLYVERLGPNQYTHEIGTKPDTEFISKLEKILEKAITMQTKGFDTGYR